MTFKQAKSTLGENTSNPLACGNFRLQNMFKPYKPHRTNMFELFKSSRETFTTHIQTVIRPVYSDITLMTGASYIWAVSQPAAHSLSLSLCCISCVMVVFALALGRAHFFILLPVLSNTRRTSITLSHHHEALRAIETLKHGIKSLCFGRIAAGCEPAYIFTVWQALLRYWIKMKYRAVLAVVGLMRRGFLSVSQMRD